MKNKNLILFFLIILAILLKDKIAEIISFFCKKKWKNEVNEDPLGDFKI